MRTLAAIALIPGTLLAAAPADASTWSVRSPSNALAVSVRAVDDALLLRVQRQHRGVLRVRIAGGLAGARAARGRVRTTFTTPAGKRRVHRLDARRLALRARGGRGVEVLVADDGVAYRVLGGGAERSALRPPRRAEIWLQSYRPDYEAPYRRVRLGAADEQAFGLPALIRSTRRDWALVTEAGVRRGHSAAHLEARGGALRPTLMAGERTRAATPWRVAVIGDLKTIVASDLPLALGPPSRIADPSWITPGRAAWSWWSDPRSGPNEGRQRQFVEFAARMGWEYVLVDAGWDAAWVPALVEYARKHGVRVLLWFDWHAFETERSRRETLGRVAEWGVAGVKVDFLLSDRADRIAVYDDIARVAADHRLVVNFHGSTVPRGIQSAWPNVLTMEAVMGAEYAMQGSRIDPRHNVNLVFTRNVIGSMDYTPTVLSATNRLTTPANELAQAVIYESGIQHPADSPESYEKHPEAVELLRALPAAWDDVRLLGGAPDSHAIIARRAGDRWFVGAIVAATARTVGVPLDFLAPGRRYAARLVGDGADGRLAGSDRIVDGDARLEIPVPAYGGFTITLTPVD